LITQFLQSVYATTEHEIVNVADSLGHVADTVAHAVEGAHGAAHEESHELPNILQLLSKTFGETFAGLYHWENIIFAFLAGVLICVVATTISRKRKMVPGRVQAAAELIVEGLYNFFHSILGDHARKYTPFLGTLFIYILTMNYMGMLPFFKSPSSAATITISLAIIVFFYSQTVGFKHLGVGGWFYHMLGQPKDGLSWGLSPLFLVIHLIGEVAKPLSLSLRLFGNISGEDILIAAFTGIGIMALSFMRLPVGLPLQLPFYFLGLLMSTIQALVFTSLSAIYISMMLPHEDHAESH
jgi:F-type H+-transporting ATPase subunit a